MHGVWVFFGFKQMVESYNIFNRVLKFFTVTSGGIKTLGKFNPKQLHLHLHVVY